MLINSIRKIKKKFYSNIIENLYLYFFSNSKNIQDCKNINNIIKKYKKRNLSHWEEISFIVLKKLFKYGFDNFLRIRDIKNTMFVDKEKNFRKYLNLVDLEKDYEIIKENPFGNPKLSEKAKFTSINKLHQFYHLKFFNKVYKKRNTDCFVELGGGYGLLCLLTIKYFRPKKYIIYDLEGFLLIQKKYLKAILSNSEFNKIEFISDINLLYKKLSKIKRYNFFALWSYSEMNFELRKLFINMIKNSKYFLSGYQDNFLKLDNRKYFIDFIKNNNNFLISRKKHPCFPRNYYLIGKNKIS